MVAGGWVGRGDERRDLGSARAGQRDAPEVEDREVEPFPHERRQVGVRRRVEPAPEVAQGDAESFRWTVRLAVTDIARVDPAVTADVKQDRTFSSTRRASMVSTMRFTERNESGW